MKKQLLAKKPKWLQAGRFPLTLETRLLEIQAILFVPSNWHESCFCQVDSPTTVLNVFSRLQNLHLHNSAINFGWIDLVNLVFERTKLIETNRNLYEELFIVKGI